MINRILVIAMLFSWAGGSHAQHHEMTDPKYADERPPITPAWALQPWIWEDNGNTLGSVTQLVKGYEDHAIPFGVIMIDSPWETAYNTYRWDTIRYPRPEMLIEEMHQKGIRVVVWMTANMNLTSQDQPLAKHPDYEWLIEQGYVTDNGDPWNWWKGDGVHIDFTNPEAVEWLHRQLDPMLEMGIDGWKTDAGANKKEKDYYITSQGRMSRRDFRALYYKDILSYSLQKNPEAIILARPYSHQGGFASTKSSCKVGWCGDFTGDWEGLQLQMDNIYRSAMAGYSVVACEVGGFQSFGYPFKESFIRYAQFGALCPAMINGGHNGGLTNHLPWYYDDETVDIYRYYATLHSELVPYIFSHNVEGHETGTPIIRNPDIDDAQHTLGEFLFASFIVEDALYKKVRFPEDGYWINYWDEEQVFKAGKDTIVSADLGTVPLYIKAGAILPMDVKNGVTGHGDKRSAGKQTVYIYPFGKTNYQFNQPLGEGTEFTRYTLDVDEDAGTIEISGEYPEQFLLYVKTFRKPDTVAGCDQWYYDPDGKYSVIEVEGDNISLKIKGLEGYTSLNNVKK